MSQILRYEHDTEADAIYVYLADKPYAYGADLSPERRVDFAADRSAIGVELSCLSHGVSLSGLPASTVTWLPHNTTARGNTAATGALTCTCAVVVSLREQPLPRP